jgi:pseudouridine kinase
MRPLWKGNPVADPAQSDLGAQERVVLGLLTANPFAGQQEIATALGLARSTVAAHIASLVQKGYVLGRGYVFPSPMRIFCCGGATIDRKYNAAAPIVFGTSNPVQGHRSFGGVARNVAENLARLGVDVSLMTIVGDDENGRTLVRHLRDLGVDTGQVAVTTERMTAEYAAVLGPDSNLIVGVADMAIFDLLGTAHIERIWPHLASANWLFADCNLPADMLAALIARKAAGRFSLAVDTVSTHKAVRLPRDLAGIDVLFLNIDEATAYLAGIGQGTPASPEAAARTLLKAGAHSVVLTLGADGYVTTDGGKVHRHPAVRAHSIDVTGAGDAMIAGTLYRLLSGAVLDEATATGALLAAMTTETDASVVPNLSPRLLSASEPRVSLPLMEMNA